MAPCQSSRRLIAGGSCSFQRLANSPRPPSPQRLHRTRRLRARASQWFPSQLGQRSVPDVRLLEKRSLPACDNCGPVNVKTESGCWVGRQLAATGCVSCPLFAGAVASGIPEMVCNACAVCIINRSKTASSGETSLAGSVGGRDLAGLRG